MVMYNILVYNINKEHYGITGIRRLERVIN
jgi:hypothetical protein